MPNSSLPPFLEYLTPNPSVPFVNALFPASNDIPPAHVHWWPCKQAALGVSPSTVFLFIPGNPGVIDFYSSFLTAIYNREESGSLAILSHSYIGHDPIVGAQQLATASRNPVNCALSIQIQNTLRVLDALSTWVGVNTRIVIAGHSAGSWVALQVLKLRSTAISGVFLLFPTITNIARTPKGQRLSRFFRPPFPRIVSHVARILHFVPLTIFFRLFSNYPVPQVEVLQSFLLSPSSIFAVMTTAHDEMLNIRELDTAALDKYRHLIWFYFAEKDDWVEQGRDAILQVVRAGPGQDTVRVAHGHRDIPHAFCINHGEAVAAQCYEWLVSGEFV